MFWLQKKRRKFGDRKKRDTTDSVPMTEAVPGGLVGASRRDPLEEETVNEDGGKWRILSLTPKYIKVLPFCITL